MKTLHPKNIHNQDYDLDLLSVKYPLLEKYKQIKHGKETIDFSDAAAVKVLNSALLYVYYDIKFWEFSEVNLCPPIPGRVDYIHYLNDLVPSKSEVHVLDIGTGATCIYPLLGNAVYNWNFTATDVDQKSLKNAQEIIEKNGLQQQIIVKLQTNKEHILKGVVNAKDKYTFTMCNPPFYTSEEEALGANRRKSRNLGNNVGRNFSGKSNELWYRGGEKAFLHNYLYESSLYKEVSTWFTSLVSKKENVASLEASAKKLGVKQFKVIPMNQGNKITRIVCWQF